MTMWRLRLDRDSWSEPMSASAVVSRLFSVPNELAWIESDTGCGAFAEDVAEIRDLIFSEHLGAVAKLYLQRSGEFSSWVFGLVDHVCTDDPPRAIELIRSLVSEAKDDEELAYIGAGPLEDLLRRRGPAAIGLIEAEAAADRRFRFALAGVWPSERNPDVWKRWSMALGDQERY
jgi:hypothetical protein